MNAMTAEFLRSAFGGESQAHMRYLVWGDHADKKGFKNIGRLYQAVAYAEQAHASGHFRELSKVAGGFSVTSGAEFGLGTVVENLQGAINGELHEVEQMYPVYLAAAKFQKEKGAEKTFHYALEAEKIHAELFKQAQDAAREEKDFVIDKEIYVCPVCGYTGMGEEPEFCPVCGVKKALFKKF